MILLTDSSIAIKPISDQRYESDVELLVSPVPYGEDVKASYSLCDALKGAGGRGSALSHTAGT